MIDYSIDISIIIVLIFVIRFLTKKLPAWWHYTLWLVLLLFMMIPLEFEKPASIPDVVPVSIEENLFEFNFIKEDIVPPGFSKRTSSDPEGIYSKQPDPQVQNRQNLQGAHIPVNDIILFIWLASAIFFGIYILVKNILFWNTIKREPLLTEKKVLNLMEECKIRMKSHTPLKVIITDKVKSPALFGCIRPRLLLPAGILDIIDEKELSYIFMHELGHIKRHDVTMTWLTIFLQAIHWFNPLVWFSFHIMKIDQEAACDDFVLSRIRLGQSRDYGNAIVSFLDKFSRNLKVPALAGILENKAQIKRRMKMIINYKKYSKMKMVFTSIFLFFICLVFFSITGFSKEDKGKPEKDFPVTKEIPIENQSESIASKVTVVETHKEAGSFALKSPEAPVAGKDRNEEEKKIIRLAAITPEKTISEQDNKIENKAVPEVLDNEIKKISSMIQDNVRTINKEKKLITEENSNVQPVLKDKDKVKKKPLIEPKKDLKMYNYIDEPDNREIIRLAGVTQKTPENEDMKDKKGPEKLSSKITGTKKKTLEKIAGQKPVKLSRQCQVALIEAQKYLEKEDYSEARKAIFDYLAKKPEKERTPQQVYLMLGYLWVAEGEMEEAIKVFKEGFEIYSADEDLLTYYASTLYEAGYHEEAREAFKEGYEAYPEEGRLAGNAFFLYKTGDYEEASQLYEKLYDIGQDKNVKYLEYAAQSHIKSKNWEEAKRLYKRLLGLPVDPEPRWLNNIIALCKRLKQTGEAENYKKQLKKLNNKSRIVRQIYDPAHPSNRGNPYYPYSNADQQKEGYERYWSDPDRAEERYQFMMDVMTGQLPMKR
jgi:beta-lactamase regulating signal transducer with metallopeptidase domain/tetratricopeptide (TPR) repeat protein